MAFSPQELNEALARIARDELPAPARYVVALSGGVDSVALLHALCERRDVTPIGALHVDHGLHSDSARWAAFARSIADALDVDVVIRRAAVVEQGLGLEAAARAARYQAFEAYLEPGDWLLTAHHQDDQAETFLLHALRGSGPRGLAAMARSRPCGAGFVVRPLLDVARSDLKAYATEAKLRWLDDPANDDARFDRNFLRHNVLPMLKSRWPAAVDRLAQSALLSRGASDILDELAALDLERVGSPRRLSVGLLSALSAERQINLIRFALRIRGLPAAPGSALRRIIAEVLPASVDAQPVVSWSGGEARRYRDGLYLLAPESDVKSVVPALKLGHDTALGPGQGCLHLTPSPRGLPKAMVEAGLDVRYRAGGERLRPQVGGRSRKLKTLLQEGAVVPWMRARIPLLYHETTLVAVADLWMDQDVQVEDGFVVEWLDRPPLF